MRSPAMIRWPGKVPSGVVSDEIVSALDWLPTVASMSGVPELVPSDRPIDGVDQSAFLLGQTEKSAREYVVAYQGEKVWAVKWRNMKVHFAAAEGTHSIVQTYTFPQVFDIKEGPKESYELWGNEGYIHAWVMAPVTNILTEIGASMVEFPNIAPGQDFDGYK
jgi:arylsulfatase A-like enzyme